MKKPSLATRALEALVHAFTSQHLDGDSHPRRNAAWRELAQRRGGRCNERSGRVTATTPPVSVDVPVGFTEARLELTMDELGSSSKRPVTSVRSHYLLGAGPAFEISPYGISSDIAGMLGFESVSLGAPEFDDAFVVRGRDRAGIQSAWPLPVQQLAASRLPTASVWSDGSQVRVNVWGVVVDPLRLDAMVDVVSAVAGTGAAEFRALAELPGATLLHSRGTWDRPSAPRLELETAEGTAVARLRWIKSNPRVWMALPTPREVPSFRVIVRGSNLDGLPTGLLSEQARVWLERLDGALLLSEPGTLHVRWLGIPLPDGLVAGVKLLAELAEGRHHVGAFR